MTRKIFVGGVAMGGGAPVSIQSMLNTKTTDVAGCLRQLHRLKGSRLPDCPAGGAPCRRGSKLRGDRGAIAPAFGGGHSF